MSRKVRLIGVIYKIDSFKNRTESFVAYAQNDSFGQRLFLKESFRKRTTHLQSVIHKEIVNFSKLDWHPRWVY